MSYRDYYSILELKKDAKDTEITTQYHKLALKTTENKILNKYEAETRLKELHEAYGILSDKTKRANYDKQIENRERERRYKLERLRKNPKILSIFSLKGGAGNSTVSIQLAYGLAKSGKRILLADLDTNFSSTYMCINQYEILDRNDTKRDCTLYDKFINSTKNPFAADDFSILQTKIKNLFMLPGHKDNFELNRYLVEDKTQSDFVRNKNETTLKYILNNCGKTNNIDYIVLDLPTQKSELNETLIKLSNFVVTPLKLDLFADHLVHSTQNYIKTSVSKNEKSQCKFLGFIFNVFGQNKYSEEFIRESSDEIALLATLQSIRENDFLYDKDSAFNGEVNFLLNDIEKTQIAPATKRKYNDSDDEESNEDEAISFYKKPKATSVIVLN